MKHLLIELNVLGTVLTWERVGENVFEDRVKVEKGDLIIRKIKKAKKK